MASKRITVASNGLDITITPTRLWFREGEGNQTVIWNPAGPSIEITAIKFNDSKAPVTDIKKVPGSNDWQGTNNTDSSGDWKYTISLTVDGEPLSPLDPELKNGPPIFGDGWS